MLEWERIILKEQLMGAFPFLFISIRSSIRKIDMFQPFRLYFKVANVA